MSFLEVLQHSPGTWIADLFLGIIQWEGGPRDVLVLETEGGTLVGMALLGGYRVTMDVEPGGMISIESLANPSSILPRF